MAQSPEPWRRIGKLLELRAGGTYNLEQYRKWIAPKPISTFHRLTYALLAMLPVFFAVAICVFLLRLTNRRHIELRQYNFRIALGLIKG